jgi:hypothetical protein
MLQKKYNQDEWRKRLPGSLNGEIQAFEIKKSLLAVETRIVDTSIKLL